MNAATALPKPPVLCQTGGYTARPRGGMLTCWCMVAYAEVQGPWDSFLQLL